jgi:RNA polymerase sigma-70 factor, ECF subfamily
VGRSIPSLAEQDDTSLVRCSQRGDQDAFALLVQRHQRRVFLLSVRLLQNPEEANEATQEAFWAAWQGLAGFRGDALFSSWLYRIAYRCCLHVLDLRKREQFVQENMQAEYRHSAMGKEQQAMENIERHDQQVMVQRNVAQMPATYRVVLRLRFLHERTYEEMADILAMPLGTIKTTLFRAKRLLKERLLSQHRESTL